MASSERRIRDLAASLPDPEAAERFYQELSSRAPETVARLSDKEGLLADLLTLSSFSPLLATTILQNPDYIWWLENHRSDTRPRNKEELIEALQSFSLNEDSPFEVTLSRFKRRELLRVFLLDIKRLVTISETTDEISHLADAILEFALTESRQRVSHRYGVPLSNDGVESTFAVVSLGKLGSRELNYSSDIDLLFIYSEEGETSGGESGKITNKEFHIKMSEMLVKLVGTSMGEGSAYRVDMRLRPHGRVGPLAISLKDARRYYRDEARPWEKQMLIRARASAGDERIFKDFINSLSESIYPKDQIPSEALKNVRLSKELIDREQVNARGFNVKLGIGGIREIEFIAQALQLAFGSGDRWIRSPHTIKALNRLRDRGHISDEELVDLKNSYEFLRQVEHVLQMEHGLQTHSIPEDEEKQSLIARRIGLGDRMRLKLELERHAKNVSLVFRRIFGEEVEKELALPIERRENEPLDRRSEQDTLTPALAKSLLNDLKRAIGKQVHSSDSIELLDALATKAPHFAERLIAMPWMFQSADSESRRSACSDAEVQLLMRRSIASESEYPTRMSAMRKVWTGIHFGIVCSEVMNEISHYESKRLQTVLAEASMECALRISAEDVLKRPLEISDIGMAILGLGKLGGRGIDYGSDLDLVLIHDDYEPEEADGPSKTEIHTRISELFVNALSNVTRDGQVYRVDLRLRPDGRNGPMCSPAATIAEYFETRAAIWEWLAYLKVRNVGGVLSLGDDTEHRLRVLILERAASESIETLANETSRIRERLATERLRNLDSGTVDIKYGRGGLLDIYFASRFLQLAFGVDEIDGDRSTTRMLEHLKTVRPDLADDIETHQQGYEILSRIDHSLRLSQGRSTRLSLSNSHLSDSIRRTFPDFPLLDIRKELPELMRSVRFSFDRILSGR